MKNIIFIVILFLSSSITCIAANSLNPDSLLNKKIEVLMEQNEELSDKIDRIMLKAKESEIKISELKERHKEQVEYYSGLQTTIIWIVSIIFLILSGSFTAFVWLFKRPEEIWEKLKDTEKEACELLSRLEKQYEHQESLFILKGKGLYFYTPNEWEIIKTYAENSENIDSSKRSANDWLFIGLWEYKSKNYVKSINAFKKATEIDSGFEIAYKNLGNSYDAINEFDKAALAYEKVIEINPLNEIPYNNLGIIYGAKRMYQKADNYFTKAIKLNPNDGFIYTNKFENDLVFDKPFDNVLVEKFVEKFKNDDSVFVNFEMLNVYRKILEGGDVDTLVIGWNGKYETLKDSESFREVENWINNKPDGKLKTDLTKALNTFKEYQIG